MFQQAISGLNAASRNLEVIGNNIANANTVGAKVTRAEFSDVYAAQAAAQGGEGGMGVRITGLTQQFGQGTLKTTDNPLDIAINGRGFFTLAGPNGGESAYTRAGQFQLDAQDYIVTNQGWRLQGYGVDAATGKTSGSLTDIRLPSQGMSPKATTSASLVMNLDGRTPATDATTPAFSTTNPASYGWTTAVSVFDQQGNEQTLSLYFRRTAVDNTWDVYAATGNATIPPTAAGATPDPVARLQFSPDGSIDPTASGNLVAGVVTPGDLTLDVPFAAGTLAGGATTAPVTVKLAGSTQYSNRSAVTQLGVDGHAAGNLVSFSIDGDGTVQARYSNGLRTPAARIALADFRNEQGLASIGGSMWRATPAAGAPAIGTASSGNLGALQGGALEQSNVDLTQQLVDMISAQRAYQASAQTIKTADQVMSTLVNMR